jgi:hypothetical protein
MMVHVRNAFGPVLALAFAACSAPQPPAVQKTTEGEPQVALQVVKWPELEKAIAAHKGKVVVLDIWAEY